jgi:hypothetical protein
MSTEAMKFAMDEAIIRRSLTAKTRVRTLVSFVGDKAALG